MEIERSERINDAVQRLADAAAQISLAVQDVNELAGQLSEEDITPETRLHWQGFVDALTQALETARLMLDALPKTN